jgi:hypothetical protein
MAGEVQRVHDMHVTSDVSFEEFTAALEHEKFGAVQVATFTSNRGPAALLKSKDAIVSVSNYRRDGDWEVSIGANSAAEINRWISVINALLPERTASSNSQLMVTFWSQNPKWMTASSFVRGITAPEWSEIQNNYPNEVQGQLSSLMAMQEPTSAGKIMLFHGLPGGGKSRSILSLMRQWSGWCNSSVVTDPDRLFGDATYLNSLLAEVAYSDKNWLLLVVEDGDEFIDKDERSSKGQGIARILNVADGILGQGLNLLTLITTNVKVESLNPAMARPGRCMANVHFSAFDAEEAAVWAAKEGFELPEGDQFTLAELYDLKRTFQIS